MTLKWAIIGTGFISNKAIDGIKKSDGSQLHSVFGLAAKSGRRVSGAP
ncbi:hypothetical protein L0Z66_00590 [Phaeobacter sp. BS34]